MRNGVMLLLLVLAGTLVAACKPGDPGISTGAYPIEVFTDMHYNQSYKAQEPPRLAPPVDSVPITGKEAPLPAQKADAKTLANPIAASPANLRVAAEIYMLNCAMCHGAKSDGQGFVGNRFAAYGATRPPAFGDARITALTPGEAYWSVTKGFGFMPPFGNLLTSEQRWELVNLIKLTQADREALLNSVAPTPSN